MPEAIGIRVEYTRISLKTGEILDRYCVDNPDDCCEVATCKGGIVSTLYFSPSSFLLNARRTSPITTFKTLAYCLEFIWGANAINDHFPLPTYLVNAQDSGAFPHLWEWEGTLEYGLGPDNEPDNTKWTFPYFYLITSFRVQKNSDDPSDCTIQPLFTTWTFRETFDGSSLSPARYWSGDMQASVPGFTPQCLIPSTGEFSGGYLQFNPFMNYITLECQYDTPGYPSIPTASPGFHLLQPRTFTSAAAGFEIPPRRTYPCPSVNTLPPTVQATITLYNWPITDFGGTYTLTWKHGAYYFHGTTGANRFSIEYIPSIGKYAYPLAAVRWTNQAVALDFAFIVQNVIAVSACEPLAAAGTLYLPIASIPATDPRADIAIAG